MSGLILTHGSSPSAERVPPKAVRVDVHVVERIARHQLAQTFVNAGPSLVEAAYVFPLSDGVAISAFRVLFSDGREIVGEVRERSAAEAAFDEATCRGLRAAMLREESGDVFRTTIGNLAPGEEVEVMLEYCLELPVVEQAVRLTIPSHVAPRYCPGQGTTTAEARSQAASLGFASAAPGATFTAKVEVDMAGGVRTIESPTHALVLTQDSGESGKSFAEVQCIGLQSDIVFSVCPCELFRSVVTREVHTTRGTEALMLSLVPRFQAVAQRIEAVFVLDCSGSMRGHRIEQAKRATQIFLRSLPADCFFNIVLFGSSYKTLFEGGSGAYSQTTLHEATAYVDRVGADMGGTEILRPLSSVLAQRPATGAQRQIFLLTDGQVSNQQAVFDLVRAHSCRVFSIGIGSGVSTALVNGVARATGGSAAFVQDREGLEPVCVAMLRKASSPGVTDLTISWPAVPALRSQTRPRPMVSGEGFSAFTLFPHSPLPAGAVVKVTGDIGTSKLDIEVPVPSAWKAVESGGEAVLHHMFARRLIAEVQEGGDSPTRKEDAVQLSVTYSVLCPYTAVIAVDRQGVERPAGVVRAADLPGGLRGRALYASCDGANPFSRGMGNGVIKQIDSESLDRLRNMTRTMSAQCELESLTRSCNNLSAPCVFGRAPARGWRLPSGAGLRDAFASSASAVLGRAARAVAALSSLPAALRTSLLGRGRSTAAAEADLAAPPSQQQQQQQQQRRQRQRQQQQLQQQQPQPQPQPQQQQQQRQQQRQQQQQQQQLHGLAADVESAHAAVRPAGEGAPAARRQPYYQGGATAARGVGDGDGSTSKLPRLGALLRLADFDGSFKHSPGLRALTGLDATWSSAWAQEQWGGAVASEVLVTAGVLAHLAREFAGDRATWELVAGKSTEWLRSREGLWRGGSIDSVDTLLQAAAARTALPSK